MKAVRMKLAASALVLLLLSGCTPIELSDSPQSVKDRAMPVALVLCNEGERGCYMVSRHNSFNNCEFAKRWMDASGCERTRNRVTCSVPETPNPDLHCVNKEETFMGLWRTKF